MHETVSTLTKMSHSLETGLFDSNPNEKVKIKNYFSIILN